MLIPESLLDADRSQLFIDWGTPVVYQQVVATLDPATQVVSEAKTDLELSALLDAEPISLVPNAAGQLARPELSLLVQSADLPQQRVSIKDRILHAGREYDILSASQSPDGRTWRIQVRERLAVED